MNKLKRFLFNKGSSVAYAIITAVFTVVPEDFFKCVKLKADWQDMTSATVNRLIICVVVFLISSLVYLAFRKKRKTATVSGNNYTIQIECGDLLDHPKGKTIINFDECFTTQVGDKPSDVKPDSVCGQYLKKNPIDNMQELIDNAGIKPAKGKSQFKNQVRYEPGTIVPNGEFLLMAFAKLDKYGRGYLNYEDYLECLNTLWDQVDLYHGTCDVFMPILGSKITRFEKNLTQQELLDIIIFSYRLSSKRMKRPCKLHIVYQPKEGFSVNNISGVD